ncbi:nicotinate-nucleotide--dimethylbenzimidazole phosphoribosyltransferase [Tengunoibacter tsumagoiensis]|uniref:Nicotinate-nucleotide--dimethylbenzimidazole phosphoribosyltransferase n=1 Tax=Tengunoibacter tsumagoiensis TaxID=2014871 RepID=A0A401ZYS8_9CHLR|nr:nicotinate-nucleotide--dimethylbenzimidazole phosphoribosyltransferase [Tengunoibacter tsumagoiensis]GCE11983.1 nicotinate-nucleotide--dimethylbenzimidazole phosphoribosyltransferase [Tengunoibacter tsumagoiensis]
MLDLQSIREAIQPINAQVVEEARQRQLQLTKPAGSLGRLEEIALQLAGITGQVKPPRLQKAVVVMAADHGVTAEGVSAYPAEVTPQMVLNFLAGGAAINALSKQAQAEVVVVDIGVASELSDQRLISRKIRWGTANMARGAAMTHEEALQAIAVGYEIVTRLAESGTNVVATGEMGIGNTTAASALTAALLGRDVAEVTGRGTGINDQQLAQKIRIIEQALATNQPDRSDPLDVLAKVGGLEIAGLVGVILGAAERKMAVVIDGFISGAAALVAVTYCPTSRDYLFAGHISVERGHRLIVEALALEPLLDLHLRLGEGTGAVLAFHLLDAALATHNGMSTFGEAGVSEKEG